MALSVLSPCWCWDMPFALLRTKIQLNTQVRRFFSDVVTNSQMNWSRRSVIKYLNTKQNAAKSQVFDSEIAVTEQKSTGFSNSYRDIHRAVDKFVQCSTATAELFFQDNVDRYFAPYTSLIQSSGYGKTRLVLEASRRMPTMYVNFRDQASSGHPPRTTKAIASLFDGLSDTNPMAYVEDLTYRIALAVHNGRKLGPLDPTGVDFKSTTTSWAWDLHAATTDLHRTLAYIPDSQSPPVLLVFDEARVTTSTFPIQGNDVSQFRLIRRALRLCAGAYPQLSFVAVFVDTTSRLSNFSPPASKDVSARTLEGDGHLFEPFVLRGTYNVFFSPLTEKVSDWSVFATSSDYLLAGRPLTAMTCGVITEDFKFLSRKLNCGLVLAEQGNGALSHMLCRLGSFVDPHARLAGQLVAENMATLISVSHDRERMMVMYLPEPKLAIAAARKWDDEALFCNVLVPSLQTALASGAVTAGARGELAAQIAVLRAFDAVSNRRTGLAGSAVPLMEVLTQLLPPGADAHVDLKQVVPLDLHDAQVACAQFVSIDHRIHRGTLAELARLHCGVVLRDQQQGVDFAVPILKGELGLLLFQVKNYQGPITKGALTEIFHNMLPSKAFGSERIVPAETLKQMDMKCVRVLMQTGGGNGEASVYRPRKSARTGGMLFLDGIRSRCLSGKACDVVNSVCRGMMAVDEFVRQGDQLRAGCNVSTSRYEYLFEFRTEMGSVIGHIPSFEDLTVKDLRSLCSKYNLSQGGRKADLVQRLSSHPAAVKELEGDEFPHRAAG
eukprot:CAMPEP_0113701836 /NCGR_PEP_ID=MMETSP0038_2-20120614/24815_1 /TAXON_ID=2898 /ORGANISM="Cryptomonas paramecium" /LENGTH=778 /DNA_ID=CAMNT_0000625811 /DNA_START=1 /DNA_END=2337 /DNA_ORIENTATION=+ /assembly_acc=CAM_ASM_000170